MLALGIRFKENRKHFKLDNPLLFYLNILNVCNIYATLVINKMTGLERLVSNGL